MKSQEMPDFISASDFWTEIAKPTFEEFLGDRSCIRRASLMIWSLDATVSHILWLKRYEEMLENESRLISSLAKDLPAFNTIHQASNNLKHAKRTGKSTTTTGSASIVFKATGWGEAMYGVDEYGGSLSPYITYIAGNLENIHHAATALVKWIEDELR